MDPAGLADNGGSTLTIALLAGSDAIDQPLTDDMCLATDQRGEDRPADGDGDETSTCDIGAFEASAPAGLIVNDNGDDGDALPGDGTCETGDGNGVCTLRAAVEEANKFTGVTITFDSPVIDPLISGRAHITITSAMTITGHGADQTTIDGGGNSRIFEITEEGNISIADVTLSGGHAPGGVPTKPGAPGGAIMNAGTLTITASTLSGNNAGNGGVSGNGGSGGAIANTGSLTIIKSVLSMNETGTGGPCCGGPGSSGGNGGAGGAIMSSGGSFMIINTSLTGNATGTGGTNGDGTSGTTGPGGAIQNSGSGAGTITNSTLAGNTGRAGGAISIPDIDGTLTLANTLLAGNTDTGSGGNCGVGESADLIDGGGNLDDGDTCGFGAGSLVNTDPSFVDAADPDDGLALQATSLAINAGDNGAYLAAGGNLNNDLDLAGNHRVFGGNIDIGAYEFQGEPAIPEAADNRILLANTESYIFTPADFGQTDNRFVVVIDDLMAGFNGQLQVHGSDVNTDDEISVEDIDNDELTYTPPGGVYGYGFDQFEFIIEDNLATPSRESYTMSLDVAATSVNLTAAEGTSGEGWRFLASPVTGETYDGLLGGLWTQGLGGCDYPPEAFPNLYTFDQETFDWTAEFDMSETIGPGTGFIIYVFEDDNFDGSIDPDNEAFPKTLTPEGDWLPFDGSFTYSGLNHDSAPDPDNPNDNYYLLGNPLPIPLDFCKFAINRVAQSIDIWDPAENGGNGDYVNLNCANPLADVHIAPFQAFWVLTLGSGPSLGIPTEAYLPGSVEGFFKKPSQGSKPWEGLALTVQNDDQTFTNTARIRLSEQASTGLDKWDGLKLSPAGLAPRWLSFYSMDADGRGYAFQSLPSDLLESSEKVSIPLDIQTTESGAFILTWDLPEQALNYFLRDNHTGQAIELREGGDYRFEIAREQSVSRRMSKTLEVSGEPIHPMSVPAPIVASASDTDRMSSAPTPRFELLIATTGVDGLAELGDLPETFELAQNYPNPFNPSTVISYQLPAASEVRLEVYDMLGRRVATLVEGQMAAGRHQVSFNASNLSSGVYLYRLSANGTNGASQIFTKKLTLIK